MRLGFTGTRNRLRYAQTLAVHRLMRDMAPTELHHGDCVGADLSAYHAAKARKIRTIGHPPIEGSLRANTRNDEERPRKSYLSRNKDIVDESDILLACPKSNQEEHKGSGTWFTIRYARKVGRPVIILWPDGRVDYPATTSAGNPKVGG